MFGELGVDFYIWLKNTIEFSQLFLKIIQAKIFLMALYFVWVFHYFTSAAY